MKWASVLNRLEFTAIKQQYSLESCPGNESIENKPQTKISK